MQIIWVFPDFIKKKKSVENVKVNNFSGITKLNVQLHMIISNMRKYKADITKEDAFIIVAYKKTLSSP